jgi:glycosyltransferase involved in cell wall biosynthesis
MKNYCDIHLVRVPPRKRTGRVVDKGWNYLRSLWNRTPYYISYNINDSALGWLKQKIDQCHFDIIEADSDAGAVFNRDWKPQKVLIKHSVLNATGKREIRYQENLITKIKAFGYWMVMRSYEKRICETVDLCVTLTKQNERELRALSPKIRATNILTNGVDLDYFDFQFSATKPADICFVGLMDYPPNIDAVLYFCREILPIVQAAHSNIKFYIVGSAPPREVRELANTRGVEVTGYVEDIRPFLRGAGIAVVPTRMGGGILNKILEPLAMGVPVVTRSRSVEGLAVRHGEELLIADSPKDFAQSVIRLVDDVSLRKKLASNGRAYVETYHQWSTIIDRYEKQLRTQLKSAAKREQ